MGRGVEDDFFVRAVVAGDAGKGLVFATGEGGGDGDVGDAGGFDPGEVFGLGGREEMFHAGVGGDVVT